jgi:hypothetical protein
VASTEDRPIPPSILGDLGIVQVVQVQRHFNHLSLAAMEAAQAFTTTARRIVPTVKMVNGIGVRSSRAMSRTRTEGSSETTERICEYRRANFDSINHLIKRKRGLEGDQKEPKAQHNQLIGV